VTLGIAEPGKRWLLTRKKVALTALIRFIEITRKKVTLCLCYHHLRIYR
jgi:hypothetical protein